MLILRRTAEGMRIMCLKSLYKEARLLLFFFTKLPPTTGDVATHVDNYAGSALAFL
jgi:hypothetical protein